MRTVASGLMALVLISGCGNAEPDASTTAARTDQDAPLSITADLMLTTLAVAAPTPLSVAELCDNAGICGGDQAEAAKELSNLGLVTPLNRGSYHLTEAGQLYLRDNYKIVRNGDRTIIETRDEGVP